MMYNSVWNVQTLYVNKYNECASSLWGVTAWHSFDLFHCTHNTLRYLKTWNLSATEDILLTGSFRKAPHIQSHFKEQRRGKKYGVNNALFPCSFLLLENKLISYAFHGGNCFEIQIWGNIDFDNIVFPQQDDKTIFKASPAYLI